MLEFIKNCFKNISVKCNDQELTGVKKVIAFAFCAILIALVLGIAAAMIVAMLALAICIIPIVLVINGVQLLVPLIKQSLKAAKMKKKLKKQKRRQSQELVELYTNNMESINNTIGALENSSTIVEDELGREVETQELVDISLEDLVCYIQYIATINPGEAEMLMGLHSHLDMLKSIMDRTISHEEREKLESEYYSIMFSVQEKLIEYVDGINSINDTFVKGTKKRRLFNRGL